MLVGLLLCEGDEQLPTDVMDPERGEPSRDSRIGEGRDEVEATVENLDRAEAEVGRVEEGAGRSRHQREALVDRADIACRVGDRRAIDGDDSVDAVNGWAPANNRAVLGREKESTGTRGTLLGDDEA